MSLREDGGFDLEETPMPRPNDEFSYPYEAIERRNAETLRINAELDRVINTITNVVNDMERVSRQSQVDTVLVRKWRNELLGDSHGNN